MQDITSEVAAPEVSEQPSRYTRIAIALHWVLALGLIYQLWLGVWMGDIPKTPPGLRAEWFNWHKSIGIILGLLIVLRGLWRLTHRPPTLPDSLPVWQTLAAHVNHALLYVCMVAMPVSGFLGSSFTAYPIKFFGTPLPRLWEASPEMKDIFSTIHTSCSYIFIATIAVHVLAALWHVVRRDGIAKRMLP
jgi:cytochrome b561